MTKRKAKQVTGEEIPAPVKTEAQKVLPEYEVKGVVFKKFPGTLPHVTNQPHGVSSHSGLLKLNLEDGTIVEGYFQVWNKDVSAHHIKAKKGQSFFFDIHNVLLKNVVGWSVN